MRSKKIYDLAKFMHERYEALSKDEGWETQSTCRVEFEDLPEENKKVMLGVAGSVIGYITNDLEKMRIIL